MAAFVLMNYFMDFECRAACLRRMQRFAPLLRNRWFPTRRSLRSPQTQLLHLRIHSRGQHVCSWFSWFSWPFRLSQCHQTCKPAVSPPDEDESASYFDLAFENLGLLGAGKLSRVSRPVVVCKSEIDWMKAWMSHLGCYVPGSFGDVVKAKKREDGKLCAIKKSRR